jgi:hypothetical protein
MAMAFASMTEVTLQILDTWQLASQVTIGGLPIRPVVHILTRVRLLRPSPSRT